MSYVPADGIKEKLNQTTDTIEISVSPGKTDAVIGVDGDSGDVTVTYKPKDFDNPRAIASGGKNVLSENTDEPFTGLLSPEIIYLTRANEGGGPWSAKIQQG